jgi:hypothetical protein
MGTHSRSAAHSCGPAAAIKAFLLAVILAQVDGPVVFGGEPNAGQGELPSQPAVDGRIRLSNEFPAIGEFLADKEGKETHDFPAWNEYRKTVSDSRAARVLFAQMLKAEPELCSALAGDAKHLNDLLAQREDSLISAAWFPDTHRARPR